MEAIWIGGALVGSFAAAFVLQKAALQALFRAMSAEKPSPHSGTEPISERSLPGREASSSASTERYAKV